MTCGTSYRNKGVQLLDAVVDYMPALTDIPQLKESTPIPEEIERHSSDSEPFAALAFKIATDPFVGKFASSIYSARSTRAQAYTTQTRITTSV